MKGLFTLLLTSFLCIGPLLPAQQLDWVGIMEGKYNESIRRAEITPTGKLAILGDYYEEVDIDPGPGVFQFDAGGTKLKATFFAQIDTATLTLDWGLTTFTPSSGTSFTQFTDFTSDASGNIYMVGQYAEEIFWRDAQVGVVTVASGSPILPDTTVGLLIKFTPQGGLLWKEEIAGGTAGARSYVNIQSVHRLNNSILAVGGFFSPTDFDPGSGSFVLNPPSPPFTPSTFMLELDDNGDFQWAGATGNVFVVDAAEDGGGNVFLAGGFYDAPDIDPAAGSTLVLTSSDLLDAFLMRLNSQRALEWAFSFGGNDDDLLNQVELTSTGDLLVTGYHRSDVDIDPGAGSTILTSTGFQNHFVANYGINQGLNWAVSLDADIAVQQMITDVNQDIVLSGTFVGDPDFDPGAATLQLAPTCSNTVCRLAFSLTLDAASQQLLTAFVWGEQGPGSAFGTLVSRGISSDINGRTFTVGAWTGTRDFDPGPGTSNLTSSFFINDSAAVDLFILSLNQGGLVGRLSPPEGSGVSIFPVPATSELTIAPSGAAPYRYELWNAQGQLVRMGKGQGQETISVGDLPVGVYTLRVKEVKSSLAQKILLQH